MGSVGDRPDPDRAAKLPHARARPDSDQEITRVKLPCIGGDGVRPSVATVRIEVDLRVQPAAARLLEADALDDLSVELVGPQAPLTPALAPAGIVRLDEHAWVRVASMRELAGATAEWEASLVDRARARGEYDEDLEAVRVRCERRLPAPDAGAPEGRRTGAHGAYDPDVFRDVIGRFATGVAVITAQGAGVDYGMTASAVASLSMEPPMLLVCLNRASVTHGVIERAGAFGVNVLRVDQGEVARRFAGTDRAGKFAGLGVHHGPLDTPLLDDALARIECAVAETVTGGTHTVFLGTVRHAEAADGEPLAYFRGRFGRFDDTSDR
jgi:flavin reductase (DIM6/NTAB) family NADH-FMN oxidoreductase RutF